MSSPLKSLLLPFMLSSVVLVSACSNNESTNDINSSDPAMQELVTEAIKEFEQTANDQHDIGLLTTYDETFNQMSDAMEDELIALKKEGKLTDEFAHQRQSDNIQSALSMLKDLNLKTEQGRYIQGLMAEYWQQQAKLFQEQKGPVNEEKDAELAMQGLGVFLHAQEQLEHWREQYAQ